MQYRKSKAGHIWLEFQAVGGFADTTQLNQIQIRKSKELGGKSQPKRERSQSAVLSIFGYSDSCMWQLSEYNSQQQEIHPPMLLA